MKGPGGHRLKDSENEVDCHFAVKTWCEDSELNE